MDSFAFITHPKHEREFAQNFFAARFLPSFLVSRIMKVCPPYSLFNVKAVASKYNRISGWVIASPITTDMVISDVSYTVKKVLAACRVARKLGARIIGLGNELCLIEGLAETISKEIAIPVINGNRYKINALMEGLKMAATARGLELSRAHVLITGAATDIGKTCAGMVANEVQKLTLYSNNYKQTEKIAKQILYDSGLVARIEEDLESAVLKADVIIAASDDCPEINSSCFKPGTIVFDIFSFWKRMAGAAGKRNDVMSIEEIYVTVKGGIDFNKDTGLPRDVIDFNMAELLLLSLEKSYSSFALSPALKASEIAAVGKLAQKHGFKVSGFLTNDSGEGIKNSVTGKIILSGTV